MLLDAPACQLASRCPRICSTSTTTPCGLPRPEALPCGRHWMESLSTGMAARAIKCREKSRSFRSPSEPNGLTSSTVESGGPYQALKKGVIYSHSGSITADAIAWQASNTSARRSLHVLADDARLAFIARPIDHRRSTASGSPTRWSTSPMLCDPEFGPVSLSGWVKIVRQSGVTAGPRGASASISTARSTWQTSTAP